MGQRRQGFNGFQSGSHHLESVRVPSKLKLLRGHIFLSKVLEPMKVMICVCEVVIDYSIIQSQESTDYVPHLHSRLQVAVLSSLSS